MDKEKKNTIKCPICDFEFDKKSKCCPKCLYKPPLSIDKALWILVLLLLPFSLFRVYQNYNYKLITLNNNQEISKDIEDNIDNLDIEQNNIKRTNINQKNSESIIKIPLRAMEDLSYKTKDEILSKRISYVKKSLVFNSKDNFKNKSNDKSKNSVVLKDYKPNPDVYRIDSKLPWISAYQIAKYGIQASKDIAKGPSRHSISINNPEVLISLITPDLGQKRHPEDFSESDYFFPKALYWNKEEKIITVYFDINTFYQKNPNFIAGALYLDETNARDLGYNWIYASRVNNVSFLNFQNNFSIKPYNIKGYYHKGLSCAKKEGCNNYSPYQEEMVIRIEDLPASLEIKLWKEKPAFQRQKADITYIMSFQ